MINRMQSQGGMAGGGPGGKLQQMLSNLTPDQIEQFNTLMSLPPQVGLPPPSICLVSKCAA